MDFDHVFVKTEKADAKYSYKQAYGYFPGVISIDCIIAYIKNSTAIPRQVPSGWHAVKGFQAASFIRLAHRHLPCRLRFLFGRYHKDCWRQLPHILHTGHTQCVNVQPHTRHTRMEACWDRLAGNGSGLGHVNTVHGGFPLTHCSATDKGKGQYTWSFRWQVHLPLHHNQWLGQWREERYRNVQQAWGERARLRPSQQKSKEYTKRLCLLI